MSGIAADVLLRVARLRVTFRDDIGNSRTISGTGFWLKNAEVEGFVTNAHNVEPRMKLGRETAFRFESAEIELRRRVGGTFFSSTAYSSIIDPDLRIHPTADVAIFVSPQMRKEDASFSYVPFEMQSMADASFFESSLSPMDVASFLGFPGDRGVPWYDQQWNMAIARTVNIASWPALPFSNDGVPTSDTMLVSGLSFSGSSGSPVLSHSKGLYIAPGSGLTGGDFVPPKIIGIMSGHWREGDERRDVFQHSGLSYLTRSTAIVSLMP